jgi:hypothetical protein
VDRLARDPEAGDGELDEIARMGFDLVEEEGSDVIARHAVIVNEAWTNCQ